MKKKKQLSVQDLIFNSKLKSIVPSFPHVGKEDCQSRVLSGRGFGKSCVIHLVDGVPVIVGNQDGIKIEE